MKIAEHSIGTGHPCFVIAEAGVNHNGDMSLAHRLIDEAGKAGANAVKFQAFVTEEVMTPHAPKANYQLQTTTGPQSQYSMVKPLELSPNQIAGLHRHCLDRGIIFICTPYDFPSADMLEALNVAAFKIASTDTTNTPFLRHIAKKNRPVLLSTGMSSMTDVELAMTALAPVRDQTAILHCTSEYPMPPEEANLRAMDTLTRAFGVPVGYSDHSPGIGVTPWAVAVGAILIEKHFTLDRAMAGPDHRASIEPTELAELVVTVRMVERALGDGIKRIMPSEAANRQKMQKSLVLRHPVAKGQIIASENLTCKRPATGLAPNELETVSGRRAARDIPADRPLSLADIDWNS